MTSARRAPACVAAVAALAASLAGCSPGGTANGPRTQPTASASARSSAHGVHRVSPPHPRPLRVDRLSWRLPQPLAREAVSAGPGRDRVLVAGGLVSGDVSTGSAYSLTLGTGRVTRLAPLPTPVHDSAGARVLGHALVLGGGNAAEQSVVQAHRPGGWRTLSRLPTARSDLSAVTARRHVYVLGGYDGRSAALADVLVSRTGARWRTLCRLPVPVRYAATAVLHGAIWVLGGERGGVPVGAIQRVDLGSRRATVVGHLAHPVGHAVAVPVAGRILLVGGRTSGDRVTARLWWYRPGTASTRPAGRLPHPLADTGLVRRRGAAYLVGGETPALTDAVLRLRWR